MGRPRGLVFDSQTGSLMVADAEEGVVVRFRGDLSVRLATRPLKGSPLERTVVAVVARDRYLPRASQALLQLVGEAV